MQRSNQARKRRCVSDGAVPNGEPLSSVQTSELVVRTPVEQYASTTSTSPNEATKGEFDLFANPTVSSLTSA